MALSYAELAIALAVVVFALILVCTAGWGRKVARGVGLGLGIYFIAQGCWLLYGRLEAMGAMQMIVDAYRPSELGPDPSRLDDAFMFERVIADLKWQALMYWGSGIWLIVASWWMRPSRTRKSRLL
jgi:hypothetical protein